MGIRQYDRTTCPGKPCSSGCDHIQWIPETLIVDLNSEQVLAGRDALIITAPHDLDPELKQDMVNNWSPAAVIAHAATTEGWSVRNP